MVGGTALATDTKQYLPMGEDRRIKPRIYIPFPAIIEGQDESGHVFKAETVLDNFSSNSMYFRVLPCVVLGSSLSITVGLSTSLPMDKTPSRISVEGLVRRADHKEGGVCGVAVTFKKAYFS